jgi:dCMP deaminase
MAWDTYFMSIALLSSYRSKDPKSRNGACIVDIDRRIIGIGYNGLPRGCPDSDGDFWGDEDDNDILRCKHTYVVHAEKNAIYNCMAHNMMGASMYVTQFPCNTCAQAIVQVGITNVVYMHKRCYGKHLLMNEAVARMFSAAGITEKEFYPETQQDREFMDSVVRLGTIYI